MTQNAIEINSAAWAFGLGLLLSVAWTPTSNAQAPAPIEPVPSELQVAPAAGRRTAAVGNAPYCSATSVQPIAARYLRASTLRDVVGLRHVVGGSPFEIDVNGLRMMGQLACAHAADPASRDWLRAYRQMIVNETDMDDATLDGLIGAALQTTGRLELPCASLAVSPTMRPHEKVRTTLLFGVCQNNPRVVPLHQLLYWYDRVGGIAGPSASSPQVERIGYLSMLIGNGRRPPIPSLGHVLNGDHLERYALLKGDLEALDLRLAAAEIDQLPMTPIERGFARAYGYIVRGRVQRYVAQIEQLAATDAVVGPYLSSLRTAALAEWDAATRPHMAALLRASAIEEAWLRGDRATLGACADEARTAFYNNVRAQNPRTEAAMRAAWSAPAALILASAWRRCEWDAGRQGVSTAIASILDEHASVRGPRTYVLQSLARAAAERGATQPGYVVRTQNFTIAQSVEAEEDWQHDRAGMTVVSVGTIATLERRGDLLHITFRIERVRIPILTAEPSNRISRVDNQGVIHFENNYRVTGSREIEVRAEPVTVHSSMAGGLAVGVYMEGHRGADPDTLALPILARPRPDGDLVAFRGTALNGSASTAAAPASAAPASGAPPAAAPPSPAAGRRAARPRR